MRNNHPPLIFSSAVMELSWMITWAVCGLRFISHSDYPIPMAMMVFFFAAGVSASIDETAQTGRNRIFIHGIGFLITLSLVWWLTSRFWPVDFTRGWETGVRKGIFISQPEPDAQWPALIFLTTWILLFWLAGMTWFRRAHTHHIICNRFDLAVSLLFLLFIVKLMLSVRFNSPIETATSIYLLGTFFLSGLFAIGAAKKNESRIENHKDAIGGGILPLFIIAIVLFGISAMNVALSHLETTAQRAYNTIQDLAGPLTTWFAMVLIFIFKPSSDSATGAGEDIGAVPGGSPPVESILSQSDLLMHGAGLFYSIMFLLALTCTIGLAYSWLTATGTSQKGMFRFLFVMDWIVQRLKYIIAVIGHRIRGMIQTWEIGDFFNYLIKWGKHSGIDYRENETPSEYANRLAHRFPQSASVVIKITEHYNAYAYGGWQSNDVIRAHLHRARKKLKSPKLWPARLRNWLLRR